MEDRIFGRRYRVTERIGSGGMADVFKAVDEVLGRTVAVKVLHERYAAEPNFVSRFKQEAQAAANLSHPSIVNMYDWGRDGDSYYIVMEYVRGTDLKTLVRERGPLDPLKVAEYGAQVCSALAVAHGYDIIHRDIKPQNIVLMPDDGIKVMDFGIARAGGTTLTQTGSVLGTAHYVSPEQAQGRALGPSSDLYSLGVVLYELVTGVLPFDADTPVAVALKQVNEEPVPPRRVEPSIPPALEAVILKAMRKDPAERYHSADEMRADLRKVAAGRPVAAEVQPRIDDTSVLPVVPAEPARRTPPRIPPAGSRRSFWPWIVGALFVVIVALVGAWALGAFDNSVAVPDLTANMNVDQARTQLEANGLALGTVEQTFSAEPVGIIVAQEPAANTRVEPGTKVDVTVSKGVEKVKVPELAGKTEEEAIAALEEAGLELSPGIKREYSEDVPVYVVIRTEPKAGTLLAKGARVTLVVSQGVETRRVPRVVGMTESQAKSALKKDGFVAKVTRSFSDTVAQGKVIAQEPTEGVLVDAGSTVTIIVSKGIEEIVVPDVSGKPEADAVAELEALGLQVTATFQDSADMVDKVIAQSPAEGTKLRRGDMVTLLIGKEPAP